MDKFTLTRQDIDDIILKFYENPDSDNYNMINNWYENNVHTYSDKEYMICVYLFLIGANIKHRYQTISYEEHMELIKEIRQFVEGFEPLKQTRKVYLDYGSRSGKY